jgi:hypothetical protein
MTASAPRTVQDMPGRLRREPILASGFDHTGAYEEILIAEVGTAHALGIPFEVVRLGPNRRGQLGIFRRERLQFGYPFLDLAIIQSSAGPSPTAIWTSRCWCCGRRLSAGSAH